AQAVGRPDGLTVALAMLAAGVVAVVAVGWAVIPMALAAALPALWLAQAARARIGGQTGDVLGAAQQLAAAAALVALAAA
ncbi:MAG TPA: adenosylcobinamide-GDP ribazoletransferase, partial [Paracoccaceae bacterium]|nr:adenosylcobinamide-GDP ribazoletransferase [Paracoccaceae bacterium]